MDVVDLPYRAEYAKTARASCRGCKSTIGKDTLRLAVLVQSPKFDGKMAQWYHQSCFFNKQKPKTTDDIEHFESLRLEDQKTIQEQIGASSVSVPEKKGKGVKRDAPATKAKNVALKDFTIEYAKSSRSTCRGCDQKIFKDEVRVSKKDFESDAGKRYGGQEMWHHLTCFVNLRSQLGYFESAELLPGFQKLKKDDQLEAKKQLPAIKQEDVPTKKTKIDDEVDGGGKSELSKEDQEKYEEQNKQMFKYRDYLKQNCNSQQLTKLLEKNEQEAPSSAEIMLDRLADVMTFGALERCDVCKGGQFVFSKQGYVCQGDLTQWTKCNTIVKEPRRRPFIVPDDLKNKHEFLANYVYKPGKRIFKEIQFSKEVKKIEEDETDKPKVERKIPPLSNMEFVILGQPKRGKEELKQQIQKLGGKVTTKISYTLMAVFASEEDVKKLGARIQDVRNCKVHVVPEEFIDEVKEKEFKDVPDLIEQKTICDWGSAAARRLPPEPTTSKSKSKSMFKSTGPSKIKVTVKGDGGAVDPASGIADIAHVYVEDKVKFTAVLAKTDLQSKENSFYKLQLLKADGGEKYWVFRSWGRIGTTIGGTKLDIAAHCYKAKKMFCKFYEEKTGNRFGDKIEKVAGKFYPMDIEDGSENAEENSLAIDDTPSMLPGPVQDLIRLLFDINAMKRTMCEFELDTEKMPLGKLSKKQLQDAYKVLNELQELIDTNAPEVRFIDATNRFYTFVPHSFGIETPPIIRDAETIKSKIDMLDSLMELEIAYNLMKSGSKHTLDAYYDSLNTTIDVVDKDSEEYKIIEEYVQNTHAETHRSYDLEIVDVFKINRQGEDKRFKPFKKLHNHKLLWHGSRTTNYAGILSQGLRIAPPEAPCTGYMFGKGIYFADMVSKSANYCYTNMNSPTGLLLLNDVALGNMYERLRSEYVTNLPDGRHCTLGMGQTEPDPSYTKEIDGVVVPLGKGVKKDIQSSLLYNEYIVYDVAQVKVKYLLKMNFKYNY